MCVSTFTMRWYLYGRMGPPLTWISQFCARWWLGDQVAWLAGRVDRPPPTFSTDSGFSSCRRVATKNRAKLAQTLAGGPSSWAGQPTPRPTQPGVWLTWSTCQIHPRGDDDFDIWSILLYHPLKCSNLAPKFLKSNKH
jgi:hypothetical protein